MIDRAIGKATFPVWPLTVHSGVFSSALALVRGQGHDRYIDGKTYGVGSLLCCFPAPRGLTRVERRQAPGTIPLPHQLHRASHQLHCGEHMAHACRHHGHAGSGSCGVLTHGQEGNLRLGFVKKSDCNARGRSGYVG